jgi:alanine dehydrogenase
MSDAPIWITEADVVDLMDLGLAIQALEAGLRLQAGGGAHNMNKTHASWGRGDTLHATGAVFEGAGFVGTKTWAHTERGATPLLILWHAGTGALAAIIEAFALGQMRTGAIAAIATRWMSAPNAEVFALIGTGKQALAQLAAVAAVRKLRRVRVWGRDADRRAKLIATARALGYDFEIEAPASVEEAAHEASIVTLVTRAREPFFTSAMATPGAHINAIGAVTPEREEFSQDILPRTGLLAADDPEAARRLSRELSRWYDAESRPPALESLCALVAAGRQRPASCDLSVFKAMGMGISDLALGVEILRLAALSGRGRCVQAPSRVSPRLYVQQLSVQQRSLS